jgi:hypothetical protein
MSFFKGNYSQNHKLYSGGGKLMQILVCGDKVLGTFSWTDGFKPVQKEESLEAEARRNPQAVIFRLLNEGREDEAEELLERFVH